MMNLYLSLEEIKAYLEISGTSKDVVLQMLNKQATSKVNSILNVSDLAFHKVVGEIQSGGTLSLELNDLNVQAIGSITGDGIVYTQSLPYNVINYMVYLTDILYGGHNEVLVDYAAGYHASGYATITIDDYSLLSPGMVVTLGAPITATITEGTDWTKGADNDSTAAALAAAIDLVPGVRSFAVGAIVYIIDETIQRETVTIAVSSVFGITLSGGLLEGVDFPEDIREAILLYIADRLNRRKNPDMKSYSIGSKSVTFGDSETATTFKNSLKHYMRAKLAVI